MNAGGRLRIWVDTDIGDNPDDAVALLVAAAHPGIDLVGVSIVGENPPVQAALACLLLEWAGASDVPVVYPPAVQTTVANVVPDLLVGIGPLGNVARVLEGVPGAPPVVLMGGLLRPVRHRGELRDAESNFSSDPGAAVTTLAKAPRCLVVPLDATVATRLDDRARADLAAVAPPLAPLFARWVHRLLADGLPEVDATVHLHDPAALLVAAGDGELIGARRRRLRLAVAADGRVLEQPDGVSCDVVVALDGPAVARRTLQILGG